MNKIFGIFLVVLLALSTSSSHAENFFSEIDIEKEKADYAHKQFFVTLNEKIGFKENDKNRDKNIPRHFEVNLYEKIGFSHDSMNDKILNSKANSEKNAIMERIHEKTKPARISNVNYLQNNGLTLTQLHDEEEKSTDLAEFSLLGLSLIHI